MNEEKKKQAMAIAEDYKIMFDAFKEVGFTDEQALTLLTTMNFVTTSVVRPRRGDYDEIRQQAKERRALRRAAEQNGGGVNENISR